MMVTYFITLFLMFVVLVIGGVLGYVFRDQVRQYSNLNKSESMKVKLSLALMGFSPIE